jgi:hypothetical protein
MYFFHKFWFNHKDPKKSTELHKNKKKSLVLLNDLANLTRLIKIRAVMGDKCIREKALLLPNAERRENQIFSEKKRILTLREVWRNSKEFRQIHYCIRCSSPGS